MQRPESCLASIGVLLNSLNTAERRVAEYILANTREVLHMPITELAERSSCAEATVVRTCRHLGYKGYQDLKIALAKDLANSAYILHKDIDAEDTWGKVAQKVFGSLTENVNDTLKVLEEQAIERAVRAIDNANRVVIYASGGSAAIAVDLNHKLVRMGKYSVTYQDAHMQAISSSFLREGDLAIGISYSGTAREIIDALEVAKSTGACTIGITSCKNSPLDKAVDITMLGSPHDNWYGKSMVSRIVFMAISELLVAGLGLLREKHAGTKGAPPA